MTTKTTNDSAIRRAAMAAKSTRNISLPKAVVEKIVSLAETKNLSIGTGMELERNMLFMKRHKDNMTFFDRNGEEFVFCDQANAIKNNQTFIAISSLSNERARVYAHFANSD